jgi:hypothetical protein
MKALATRESIQAASQGLQRPQVIARIVYHCTECDPFGSLYGDKSGTHRRKVVFETLPCSCRTSMCEQCWEAHGQDKQPCNLGCGCHDAPINEPRRCQSCQAVVTMTQYYERCPVCSAYNRLSEKKISNSIDRLRGESAVERLIAGLDRDAQDAAGRVKGVLSLCGRDLTDSETARVRAQLRAELVSFLIKANNEISQEFFDMIAVRGIGN